MAHEFGVNVNVGGVNQLAAVWHLILRMLKAGAWLRASSDGTTKVVSDNPASHTAFPLTSVGAGGAAAHITAVEDHPYGKLCTVTNVAGLVAPTDEGGQSEGNYLTLTGSTGGLADGTHQIYEVLGATSCKVLVRAGTPAVNPGDIAWQEKGLLAAPNYTLGAAQWWACLELMQTYQLSFTTAPVGKFLVGEVVTQAGTGATGEVVGVVWGANANLGWAIIQPRSGAFNSSGVLTGAWSGATVTPTALYKFRRQIVFARGTAANTYTGSIWYTMLLDDGGAEAAELYSTKAAHVACTATVAPGAANTDGNRQVNPAVANSFYVLRCQANLTYVGGAGTLTHADGIFHANTSGPNGLLQIGVANLMPRADRAADGTWWAQQGNTNNAGGGGNLLGQFRVDHGEPGEPEVLVSVSNGSNVVDSRDAAYGGFTNSSGNFSSFYLTSTSAEGNWRRIVRRAVGAANGGPFYEAPFMSVMASARNGAVTPAGTINFGGTPRVNSFPEAVGPTFREPVGVRDGFGGRLRWMFTAPLGNAYDTASSKELIVLSPYAVTSTLAVLVGPWNKTTAPQQA